MNDLVPLRRSPEVEDFCASMIVDHIDGVVAEALIDEHFTRRAVWELA